MLPCCYHAATTHLPPTEHAGPTNKTGELHEVASQEQKDEEKSDVAEDEKKESIHQIIKDKFIEGGPGFMGIVLLCLILGLALAIERIIYLNMATTNTDKLLVNVEDALNKGGIEAAQELSLIHI